MQDGVLLLIYFHMIIWHLNHYHMNIIERKKCNSLEKHDMMIIGFGEYDHAYIDLSGDS